jgi:hypothetical protein
MATASTVAGDKGLSLRSRAKARPCAAAVSRSLGGMREGLTGT